MFKFFQRLLMSIFVICTLFYGLSYVIQQTITAQSEAVDSSFDACQLPCFAGLMPGETQFELVPTILTLNLPTLLRYEALYDGNADFSFRVDNSLMENNSTGGTIYYLYQTVSGIHLAGMQVPVSHLFQELEQPDCVNTFQTGQYSGLLLYWLTDDVRIVSILPDSPEKILFEQGLSAQDLSIHWREPVPCDGDNAATYREWRGFVPLRHYGAG